jgi:uncharacterized membrane protein YfcA
MRWFRNPHLRIRLAWILLIGSLLGWPATHVLILTDPPENSWVFHVLLAISFFSLIFTAIDILATTDVRRTQDE